MAMAEGERTECAEPPRDEPPADGALKRAEELKTQANDYFKGAPGPERGRGRPESGAGPGLPGPARNHGNAGQRPGRGAGATKCPGVGGARDGAPEGRQRGLQREGGIVRSGVRSGGC